jgi:hypothetical protein
MCVIQCVLIIIIIINGGNLINENDTMDGVNNNNENK